MILINSSSRDGLKLLQPFFPNMVPLGAGYIIAVAEREGINIELIDEQVRDDVMGMIKKHVKKMERPYIFGFSVLTAALKNSIIVSKKLKELYPDSVIIFGGIHPSALPEEILSYGHIDLVVIGEGEEVVPELYRCIKSGKDFRHLGNIAYMHEGKMIKNKQMVRMEDIDKMPPFPYHRFDQKKYDLGIVMTSRGCPYDCIFCSNRVVTGKRYRFRSAASVMEDLDMIHNKYNRTSIDFWDDNLLVSKERIYALISEIKRKGLDKKITFTLQARADNVDKKILSDLFNAGFKGIFFGIETASDRLLKILKKGESVEDCRRAVMMAKEAGFIVGATFIYGIPGETHEDRMACIRLADELKLDMVRYNNATPYPGTELFEIAKREGRLRVKGLYENFNSVGCFVENPFKRTPFSYVPMNYSEDDIRMDILLSYLHFYLDTKKMIRILIKDELGWFSAGSTLLERIRKIPALFFLASMMFVKFSQLFFYIIEKKVKKALRFKNAGAMIISKDR
jgi:radical SAM superfamily enzyme YgiQ (UPF0313 family)